ncbi:phage terminase small subunit P27 family [Enterococcus alishanensis]
MPQPAKSAKLQLLNGNPNKKNIGELKKRARAEDKLKMNTNKIKPPDWLDKTAKEAFSFLRKELLEIELLTNGDVHALSTYCYWYSQQVQLQSQAALYQAENPEEIGNPLLKQLDTCSKNLRSIGSDLGLSPSARAKLAIKLAQDDGDDSEWT